MRELVHSKGIVALAETFRTLAIVDNDIVVREIGILLLDSNACLIGQAEVRADTRHKLL